MIETQNLDLYAKIEPLIGFDEAYESLYQIYLDLLNKYEITTILDVGCGNGNLLLHLQKRYEAEGIDLSSRMVEIALKKGVNASTQQLKTIKKKFDAIVAVGDVLNYLRADELKDFFIDIKATLNQGGIFICDVNTLHGFEEVTAGSMSVDFGDQFLTIDSEYLDDILTTEMTLFEKHTEDCYKKEQDTILQFYHDSKRMESVTALKLSKEEPLNMFSQEEDKIIYIFENR